MGCGEDTTSGKTKNEDRHSCLSSKRHLRTPPFVLVAGSLLSAADLVRAAGLRGDVAAAAELGIAGALHARRALTADAAAGLVVQIPGAAGLLSEVNSRVTLVLVDVRRRLGRTDVLVH